MTTTEIGSSARRTRTVTERDIALFTELTGDRNPIHYDAELAADSRFGSIVVQGGVTSGLLNALVAEQLPGPGSVFLEVAWRFLAPVRPGHDPGHPGHQPGRHHGSRRLCRRVAGPGRGRRQQRCTAPLRRRIHRHHH